MDEDGGAHMPNIKPISELRNYASILDEVAPGAPVFLTRNGHGEYAVISIKDQEEYEKTKAALKFMCEMNKGIESGEKEGWLSSDQIRDRLQTRRKNV